MDNGRFRLAFARIELARLEGNSEDRLQQVRLMATLRETEFKRVQNRYGTKSYAQEAVDEAERALLKAKLLAAVEEQQMRAARKVLERFLLQTEKRLQYLIRNPKIEEEDVRRYLAWDQAFRHYQQAEVANGNLYEFRDDPLE